MQNDEPRKLRSDLSAEQRERTEKIGHIGNRSARYKSLATVQVKKFLPSREQH